jgi:hypothetical protein
MADYTAVVREDTGKYVNGMSVYDYVITRNSDGEQRLLCECALLDMEAFCDDDFDMCDAM